MENKPQPTAGEPTPDRIFWRKAYVGLVVALLLQIVLYSILTLIYR